jgi:hypothetical protein
MICLFKTLFLHFFFAMEKTTKPVYSISHDDQRGRKIIASTEIHRGTIILWEIPFFTVSDADKSDLAIPSDFGRPFAGAWMLYQQMEQYPPLNFLISPECIVSLEDAETLKKRYGDNFLKCYRIMLANSFDLESSEDPPTKSGLYDVASCFNHSCLPNCRHWFVPSTGQICVVANETISQGSELTICYFGPGAPNPGEAFKERFFEECNCVECAGKSG